MIPIVPLDASDIAACLALSTEAGWNQSGTDWGRIISTGEAYGLRSRDGLIASAAILPYGARFGWICMILVTVREQRRGHAMRLTRHCLDRLSQRGLAAGLDATPTGRTVYLQLGFQDIYPVSRLSAESALTDGDAATDIAVEPLAPSRLPDIAGHDLAAFGGDRSVLLASLLQDRPEAARIATQGGKLAGYVFARTGRFATQVGPLIAETSDVARALARSVFAAAPGRLVIDVPDHQTVFGSWLADQGFTAQRGFMRMLRGHKEPLDRPDRIMAITGPEFA